MGSDTIRRIMRSLKVFLAIIFVASSVYAAPDISIPSLTSFTPHTVILSGEVNANNNSITGAYNIHTHNDITQLGVVTVGTWAADVIAPTYGGTGQNFSAVASGSLIYFNGTGTMTTLPKGASGAILYFNPLTLEPAWLTPGSAGTYLISGGSMSAPYWAGASGGGRPVQTKYASSSVLVATALNIPQDGTVPQSNEGEEALTCNITRSSTTSVIRIDTVFVGSCTNDSCLAVSLFQDTNANALCTSSMGMAGTNNQGAITSTVYTNMTFASQSTIKMRFGANAGNSYINGGSVNQNYGGTEVTSITITELES